jgi:hypothetical protein
MNIAKWMIVIGVTVFALNKLIQIVQQFQSNANFLSTLNYRSLNWIWLTVLLLPINIWLESVKWQLLLPKPLIHALKQRIDAVLTGITLGMITPNQIGDFAGKMIHVPKHLYKNGLALAFIGGATQTLVSIWFALVACWFLVEQGLFTIISLPTGIVLGCVIGLPVLYIYLPVITQKFKSLWILPYIEQINQLPTKQLIKIWFTASARYLVYSLQYLFLLVAFGINLPWYISFSLIALIFVIQTITPSFMLLQLGIRGISAVWLFGLFLAPPIAILLASYGLWIVNQLIPATIGLTIIVKQKIAST